MHGASHPQNEQGPEPSQGTVISSHPIQIKCTRQLWVFAHRPDSWIVSLRHDYSSKAEEQNRALR